MCMHNCVCALFSHVLVTMTQQKTKPRTAFLQLLVPTQVLLRPGQVFAPSSLRGMFAVYAPTFLNNDDEMKK